jgi:hypothetical protein
MHPWLYLFPEDFIQLFFAFFPHIAVWSPWLQDRPQLIVMSFKNKKYT